jgi:hypothetical protein
MTSLSDALDYYLRHGAALFPIPRGQKLPFGIVASFKHDSSRDRAQWNKWACDHPGLNFGVVGFSSNWIIVDIDTSGDAGEAEALALWAELCESWGLPGPLAPHVRSQSGGFHVYFSVPAGVDASQLHQPDLIPGRINVRCIGYTIAAGSQFEGRLYVLLRDLPPYPAPAALVEHCARAPLRETDGASIPGEFDRADTAALLVWMAERGMFEDYESWFSAGMALKIAFGADGFDLWALTHHSDVSTSDAQSKWDSFAHTATGGTVTIKSLLFKAHAAGWTSTVRRASSFMFRGVAELAAASAPPIVPPLPNDGRISLMSRGEAMPTDSEDSLALSLLASIPTIFGIARNGAVGCTGTVEFGRLIRRRAPTI